RGDVFIDHLHGIHAVDMIRAEDTDVVRLLILNQIEVLKDGIGGSFEPSLSLTHLRRHTHHIVVKKGRHAPSRRDVPVQAITLVLSQNSHPSDPAVDEIAQRKVDESVVSTEGDRGLGAITGQRPEALPFAASQYNT